MDKGTVLIATDGSRSSELAVEIGLRIAHGAGVPVVFVHASPDIADSLFDENPLTWDTSADVARSDPILGRAMHRASEYGVDAEIEVVGEHGARTVADAIVGVCEGRSAQMIVLGTRGRSLATEAVLGSVSRGVAATSRVPVIIVHAPEE